MSHPALFDLCCVGHLTLDRVITPKSSVEMAGGTSWYFSHALSRMPLRYGLVTAAGDLAGDAVHVLQNIGIAVRTLDAAHTVVFENRYGHNPDHRTQKVLQEATPFNTAQLEGINAKVFHLGPLVAGDISEAAIALLAAKGRVSLDVQGYLRKVVGEKVVPIDWSTKQRWLPFIHYLKVSEEELEVLTGTTDVEAGARILCRWGVQEAIVTLGSKGSLVCADEVLYAIPAYAPAHTIDTTGCGDTYMAGYLYQRVRGAAIPEAGRFAAAMATLKIEVSGPFSGEEASVRAVMEQQVLVS
ncbi:Sugar or nucleoside kinase, ribokinase family [Cnuella takakiae]|uniref:Sugar or nucleoside kinase, ribokinase family n=1 Tax=Cnuella takakiae TaxID=1302690 RepID=A0A1M5CYK1_9BACT|nr:PfkB family carbohydrate kinase [Cnuella takakiae]OLY94162.1 ribokinase [Cnuella takakiae]SHF59873.1 Sugar or nucleoside kinase, ribokinase family [Cnuella takakiae]